MTMTAINLGTMRRPPWTPKNSGLFTPKNAYPTRQMSPLLEPPDNAWPFYPNGSVTIPAIGAQATIVSVTIPATKAGVIRRFANFSMAGPGIAGWTPGDGTLVWQITRNGSPYQYFDYIVDVVGLTELGGAELAAPLHIRARDNIALIVKNIGLAPAGQILMGLLNGYLFPARQYPQSSR